MERKAGGVNTEIAYIDAHEGASYTGSEGVVRTVLFTSHFDFYYNKSVTVYE